MIIPNRVSPSGTLLASIVMLKLAFPPGPTVIDFGTVILKSPGLDVVSFHVDEAPSTLWAVRETVTMPGMFGW